MRRLWTDRAYRIYAMLSSSCYVILATCIMMKLIVTVSLDWLRLNNVLYDWR